ncbi:MAG: hypothetical protein EA397_05200 [Deltaproteobacteria bacterium]|nr:MAG: hypothetical protein EA397_05200 [Deltaproteobacteria bacterium]
MKVCPLCQSEYSDRVDFCFHDGAVLDEGSVSSMADDALLSAPEPGLLDVPEPAGAGQAASASPPGASVAAAGSLRALEVIELPKRRRRRSAQPPEDTDAPSPLVAPPPPAREPATSDPTPGAPELGRHAEEPIEDYEGEYVANAPPQTAPRERKQGGVPLWMIGVAAALLLLVLGGLAIAVGGASMMAALTSSTDPISVSVDAAPAPKKIEPLEFPEDPTPPLQLGLQPREGEAQEPPDRDEPEDTVDVLQDEALEDEALEDEAHAVETSAEGRNEPATSEPGDAEPEPRPEAPAPPVQTASSTTQATVPSAPATKATPAAPKTKVTKAPEPVSRVEVTVQMAGGGEGAGLIIDGARQLGEFPFTVYLEPGRHVFKAVYPSGNTLVLNKTLRDGADSVKLNFPEQP